MENTAKDDELYHPIGSFNIPSGKDSLSQDDLKKAVNTIKTSKQPHPALETADGKNNGAEPAVFKNQRKAQT
jgi:hypothetical protein